MCIFSIGHLCSKLLIILILLEILVAALGSEVGRSWGRGGFMPW